MVEFIEAKTTLINRAHEYYYISAEDVSRKSMKNSRLERTFFKMQKHVKNRLTEMRLWDKVNIRLRQTKASSGRGTKDPRTAKKTLKKWLTETGTDGIIIKRFTRGAASGPWKLNRRAEQKTSLSSIQKSWKKQVNKEPKGSQIFWEFDPGSGWTLAACLTHASRAEIRGVLVRILS